MAETGSPGKPTWVVSGDATVEVSVVPGAVPTKDPFRTGVEGPADLNVDGVTDPVVVAPPG